MTRVRIAEPAVVAVLLVTLAFAGSLGTEKDPEVSDQSDDVEYHPVYDDLDHRYLDFLAAWFSYDATLDEINITLKNADLTGLENPPNGWRITCALMADGGHDGAYTGILRASWSKRPYRDTVYTHVAFTDTYGRGQDVSYKASTNFSKPGYVSFSIPRDNLLLLLSEIVNLEFECVEQEVTQDGVVSPFQNRDVADSAATYSVVELRPENGEVGGHAGGVGGSNQTVFTGEATPGLLPLAVLGGLLAVISVLQFQQGRKGA